MLFVSLCVLKLLFCVIFFQPKKKKKKKTSFSTSCKAVLLEMNYFTFYLYITVFVSPSSLKDSFTCWQFFGCFFFFFPSNTLNMSFICLLATIVSDEKLAINHIVSPWCVISHFSLAAFKTYFLAFSVLTMMCLGMYFFVFIFWVPWNFCIYITIFKNIIWGISIHYYLKTIFLFFLSV